MTLMLTMILHNLKCVFLHVPKTGGLTLGNVLKLHNGPHYEIKNGDHALHLTDFNYFKFCFVRNPWDRFLSCYFYFRKYGRGKGNDNHSGDLVNQYETFKDFVTNFDSIENQFKSPHFRNQLHWVDQRLDFIGRFENLQEDFNAVCDKIGIPQQKLPHKNKTKHKHYTEYYDNETRQIVAEKYAKDIEYFGYKFGENP